MNVFAAASTRPHNIHFYWMNRKARKQGWNGMEYINVYEKIVIGFY